ncbi:uncharacterized protein A4U43_C10F16590 [Asparagus officinalis]|uniref:Secreted protein n=1 Tax=Asparagus officinalis TaxID=4686 RepID=A0A5P1E6I4_ASPOF|nr:uncharacterized protein A4U43_C10F16590 [Asparagus officinalis]
MYQLTGASTATFAWTLRWTLLLLSVAISTAGPASTNGWRWRASPHTNAQSARLSSQRIPSSPSMAVVTALRALTKASKSHGGPTPRHYHVHQHEHYHHYPHHGPSSDFMPAPSSPSLAAMNRGIHSMAGEVLGGMAIAVLPWVFGGHQEVESVHFPGQSPYYAASNGGTPRQRRQEMEIVSWHPSPI